MQFFSTVEEGGEDRDRQYCGDVNVSHMLKAILQRAAVSIVAIVCCKRSAISWYINKFATPFPRR